MTKHKYADLIKQWADGAKVQVFIDGEWIDTERPHWDSYMSYRIKPREFITGKYYPVVTNEGRRLVTKCNAGGASFTGAFLILYPSDLEWIGEDLPSDPWGDYDAY